MADQPQLEMLLRNVDEFNGWHKHAPDSIDLSNADLSGANLTEANLSGADLTGANFTGATLLGANLTDTNVKGAIFDGADLELILYNGIKNLTGKQILRAKNLPFPYEQDDTEEPATKNRQRATSLSETNRPAAIQTDGSVSFKKAMTLANRVSQEITSREQKLAANTPSPNAVEIRDTIELLKILQDGYLDLAAEFRKSSAED